MYIAGKHIMIPDTCMVPTSLYMYSTTQQHIDSPSLVWLAAFVVVIVVVVELFSWTGETWTVEPEALTIPAEKMGEDATSAVRAV